MAHRELLRTWRGAASLVHWPTRPGRCGCGSGHRRHATRRCRRPAGAAPAPRPHHARFGARLRRQRRQRRARPGPARSSRRGSADRRRGALSRCTRRSAGLGAGARRPSVVCIADLPPSPPSKTRYLCRGPRRAAGRRIVIGGGPGGAGRRQHAGAARGRRQPGRHDAGGDPDLPRGTRRSDPAGGDGAPRAERVRAPTGGARSEQTSRSRRFSILAKSTP